MPRSSAATAPQTDLAEGIRYHLRYTLGKPEGEFSKQDIFQALAHTLRANLMDRMVETEARYRRRAKRLVYLSAEFLIGQSLRNNLLNANLLNEARRATRQLGFDLDEVADAESDAPLGNGGLGRELAS